MNNTRRKYFNVFVVIITLFGLYSVVIPYFQGGFYDLNHKFLTVFVAISAALFLYVQGDKASIKFIDVILLIILSGLSILFAGYLKLSYYTKWIIFVVSLIIYCIVISNIGMVSETTYKIVYLSSVFQLIIHIIASFDSKYYISLRSGSYLILAFDNKNSSAMQLLFLGSLFILFIKRFMEKNKMKMVIISFAMLMATVYLIYLTGSRSSLIPIICMIPFLFFGKLNKCIKPSIIIFAILFPLFFAVIYVVLYKAGYDDLMLFGRKIFNGREELWINVFDGFPRKWFFGMFSDFISGDGRSPFQLHNGWVDMIASYGIIVTIMAVRLVYYILNNLRKTEKSINYLVIICVLGLILQSTGEAALMTGNRSIFVCLLFLFCERDSDDGSKKVAENRKSNFGKSC